MQRAVRHARVRFATVVRHAYKRRVQKDRPGWSWSVQSKFLSYMATFSWFYLAAFVSCFLIIFSHPGYSDTHMTAKHFKDRPHVKRCPSTMTNGKSFEMSSEILQMCDNRSTKVVNPSVNSKVEKKNTNFLIHLAGVTYIFLHNITEGHNILSNLEYVDSHWSGSPREFIYLKNVWPILELYNGRGHDSTATSSVMQPFWFPFTWFKHNLLVCINKDDAVYRIVRGFEQGWAAGVCFCAHVRS